MNAIDPQAAYKPLESLLMEVQQTLSAPTAFAAFWRIWCLIRPIRRGVPPPFDRRFACRRPLCSRRVQARSFRRVIFLETFGSFLMQKRATQCRMASVFLRNPDQGLIRKYQRPREESLAGLLSRAFQAIRMQR